MVKKSQSEVITTVLIILLVLAAVFIVYVAVRNMVKSGVGDAEESAGVIDINLKVLENSVYVNYSEERIQLDIQRGSDSASLSAIKIVIDGKDSFGDISRVYTITDKIPLALESRSYVLNVSGFSKVEKIRVYPVLSSGKIGVEFSYIVKSSDERSPETWAESARDSDDNNRVSVGSCDEVNCDDGNECTIDSCFEGVCINENKANGISCGSGDSYCYSGQCSSNYLQGNVIYRCTFLNSAGTYFLGRDIYTTGTCFDITADNVVLDGNGFYIDGDDFETDYGVYASGRKNITIKNFKNITDFYYGIYFISTSNSLIENLSASSNNYNGIYFYTNSNNNTLTNIIANSNTNNGIYLYASLNNILTNITANLNSNGIYIYLNSINNILTNITANSNTNNGIYLNQNSKRNTLINIIANSNTNGIYLGFSSQNNILTNTIANSNTNNGIYFDLSSSNNIFTNGNLSSNTNNDVSGWTWAYAKNNTFINVSYDVSKETIASGSSLIRKWYYRAYVTDADGNHVSNANITAYNVSGATEFTGLMTNSTGWTNITTITDYVNLGGTRNYYSNYTIYATKTGYQTDSHGFNASFENNLNDLFTI
ncbi:MAG: right-handed parallel beta-helix repeat-containing protein [Nanoarchaeota archaeon]|nr:right-handed parallel beta-helix repeat-containing protein [Nanoarchaeota archaeon]